MKLINVTIDRGGAVGLHQEELFCDYAFMGPSGMLLVQRDGQDILCLTSTEWTAFAVAERTECVEMHCDGVGREHAYGSDSCSWSFCERHETVHGKSEPCDECERGKRTK